LRKSLEHRRKSVDLLIDARAQRLLAGEQFCVFGYHALGASPDQRNAALLGCCCVGENLEDLAIGRAGRVALGQRRVGGNISRGPLGVEIGNHDDIASRAHAATASPIRSASVAGVENRARLSSSPFPSSRLISLPKR